MKEFKQYKIKAKDLQEKAEIIRLFEGLGYCDDDTDDEHTMVITYLSGKIQSITDNFFESTAREKITIEQLREMSMKEYLVRVDGEYVLHVGSVKPSGAVEVPEGANFTTGDGLLFRKDSFYFEGGEWVETNTTIKNCPKGFIAWQRESEKKEYLNPCKGGGYELSDFPICEDSIEVPDGAESFYCYRSYDNNFFIKNINGELYYSNRLSGWGWCGYGDLIGDEDLLWQRDKTESVPSVDELSATAWESQIGGSHYKDYAIQPLEFALANNLDAAQHAVVKYVMRHKDKNGVEDLKKAKHYIDLMIEHYY